jgi:ketosteroid isomerase-like protein
MSRNASNIESLYAAFGRGDIPFVLGLFDPHIVWNEAENFVYADGNPYVGPESVLQGVFLRLATEWDGFAATPHDIVDGGETVVSLGRYTGIYKATGAKLNAQFAHVFKFKDAKITSFQQYTDTAQARDAVRP